MTCYWIISFYPRWAYWRPTIRCTARRERLLREFSVNGDVAALITREEIEDGSRYIILSHSITVISVSGNSIAEGGDASPIRVPDATLMESKGLSNLVPEDDLNQVLITDLQPHPVLLPVGTVVGAAKPF